MTVTPIAVDLYSGDRVDDFAAAKAAGLRLIIHKATEGSTWRDPTFLARRTAAKAAGLLWASYAFGNGSPVQDQVDNFLGFVGDSDPNDRFVLDWEVGTMTSDAAKAWLAAVDEKTGKRTVLYSFASFLTSNLGNTRDADFSSHPLWLAAWRDSDNPPTPQASWSAPILWQYEADGEGGNPKTIPGIPGNALGQVDLNCAVGMPPDQFVAAWLGNYQSVDHPHDSAWIQSRLNALGANPPLTVDGDLGPKSVAAIAAFIEAHST